MIFESLKFFKLTKESVRSGDSSRRLAFGCAMGMAIGLIPKDSAFVVILGFILLCTTANLLTATVMGFWFTWIGHFLDGFSHKLGSLVLTSANLESTWAYVYDLPVLPWTRFNNTVVMGNVILAILLFYPMYRISFMFFDAHGSRIRHMAERNRFYRWIMGTPVPPNQIAAVTTAAAASMSHTAQTDDINSQVEQAR